MGYTARIEKSIRGPSGSSTVPDRRAITLAYRGTSFLSAFLLFEIQLIVSKRILPWFGGAAAVWTTSMLIFQILLLAGYVYSHLVCLKLTPKLQVRLHIALLAISVAAIAVLSIAWPSAITPSSFWRPVTSLTPVRDVTVTILLAAGLPFLTLSTTAPLLQRWFAKTVSGANTYRLYSVSNLGSLLGLLAFPFLLEPTFRLRTLGIMWSMLFCLFAVGCASCAWISTKFHDAVSEPVSKKNALPPSPVVRLLWFMLPGCASALLLATTNMLCQEVISIPLLWVVPLSLYLLSFILCFDQSHWYQRIVFQPLFVLGVLFLGVAMKFAMHTAQMILLPILLFVACMICHGELVRLRPGVQRLTSFYLSISAGGAIGGIFVAIIAPLIFRFFTEFQISLAACIVLTICCLFLDSDSWLFRAGFGTAGGIVAGVLIAAYFGAGRIAPLSELLDQIRFYPIVLLISAFVLLGAFVQRRSRRGEGRVFRPVQVLVAMLAAISTILLYQSAQPEGTLYRGQRNFYGALRIYELTQGGKALMHGHTLHGAQLNPPNDHLPMAYYGPQSGIGVFLQNHPKHRVPDARLRVGLVGLGAGTLAAYGQRSDYFRYYEIDPAVIELSTSTRPVFSYVRDSAAHIDIEQGDARLVLERELSQNKAQNFDVLVLDAFTGDAVPVHLLTLEAFDTYWQHVNPNHGVIAIHVSSRYINFLPVLEGLTQRYDASSLVNFTSGNYPFLESMWVFMARHPEDLQIDGLLPNPPPLPTSAPPRLWTDDYSDIFSLLLY